MDQGAPESPSERKRSAAVVMKLFTAHHCRLCEEAHVVLAPLREVLGFKVDVVDITDDPELESKYRSRIPVAEIDGHVVFKYRVDEERLREVLGRVRGRV